MSAVETIAAEAVAQASLGEFTALVRSLRSTRTEVEAGLQNTSAGASTAGGHGGPELASALKAQTPLLPPLTASDIIDREPTGPQSGVRQPTPADCLIMNTAADTQRRDRVHVAAKYDPGGAPGQWVTLCNLRFRAAHAKFRVAAPAESQRICKRCFAAPAKERTTATSVEVDDGTSSSETDSSSSD